MNTMHRGRRSRRGVMLVEILLALAITALIAGGVASLLMAVAGGTTDRQALRRRNARVEVISARVDAALRASQTILGRDDTCLVLWTADSNVNGMPNLLELRRIEWDAGSSRLLCYAAPPTLAPASNATYDPATTDFVTTTALLRGTAAFEATVWATDVTGWTTRPTAVTAFTRLISYDLTIRAPGGAGTFTARSAASLRGTEALAG